MQLCPRHARSGGTTFKDDDLASANGTNYGDRTRPCSARPGAEYSATGLRHPRHQHLQQGSGHRQPGLVAQLVRPVPVQRTEDDCELYGLGDGQLRLLSSLLFYSGQQNLGTGARHQPHTSGNAGFELRPFRRLRIVESWMTDRYHDAASPVAAEQILLTPRRLVRTWSPR